MIVVANKVDDERREADIWEFAAPRARRSDARCRAIHGRLSGDLLDAVVAALPEPTQTDEERDAEADAADDGIFNDRDRRAARTSASRRCSTGWSARTARSCTTCRARRATRSTRSSRPTTARCASSTPPGMRRKSRIDEPTEYYSLVRALEAIDRADAALLVIDATEGVTHQDQRLAERIDAAGYRGRDRAQQVGPRSTPSSASRCAEQVADMLGFLGYAPCSRSRRSPARACTSCCPRCARREARTTADPDRRCSTG